jgi:hypothetical protein
MNSGKGYQVSATTVDEFVHGIGMGRGSACSRSYFDKEYPSPDLSLVRHGSRPSSARVFSSLFSGLNSDLSLSYSVSDDENHELHSGLRPFFAR